MPYFPELAISPLSVTAVGASGAAVTLTLPAVSGMYHYLCCLQITQYAAAATTGAATPVTVTTTNLPGSPAFTFPTALAIGTENQQVVQPHALLQSSAVGTATTVVCPATTGIIWRVTAWYGAFPGP